MKHPKVVSILSALVVLLSASARAADTPVIPPVTPPADTPDGSKPTPTPGSQIAEQVRLAIDAAQKARADFLKAQQDFRTQIASATTQAAREKLREDLQAAREIFLTAQRQAREDLKTSIAKIKEQLKDHQDAVDNARQEAKDKTHGRKDG